MTTFKKSPFTIAVLSALSSAALMTSMSAMAQNNTTVVSTVSAATPTTIPVTTTTTTVSTPAPPKAEYVVKDLSQTKAVVTTPLAMTEAYNASVNDKKSAANSKIVGGIGASSLQQSSTTTTTTTAGNNGVNTGTASSTVNTSTLTDSNTETKTVDINQITMNVKPAEKTLKQMNEVNARLKEVKLLQELKEAEYKLLQPVEDKNKKAESKPEGGSAMSAAGNMVAQNFNPVIKANSGANANPAPAPMMPVAPVVAPPPNNANLTVYSVVGFDNDYTAKINIDGRSTYSVKKGDTLPDGQFVVDVTRYYITVSERTATGRPVAKQRIYVTGKPLGTTASGIAGRPPLGGASGNSSSASPAAQAAGATMTSITGTMPVGGVIVPGTR